jgi:hypothetical protein
VLDLDHVVAKAPSGTGVQYIAGDMFESVPPADAIFFKVHHRSVDYFLVICLHLEHLERQQ